VATCKYNELLLCGGGIRDDDVFRSDCPRGARFDIDDRRLPRVQVRTVVDDEQLGRTDRLAFRDFAVRGSERYRLTPRGRNRIEPGPSIVLRIEDDAIVSDPTQCGIRIFQTPRS